MSIPTIDHPTNRPNFTKIELTGRTTTHDGLDPSWPVTLWFSYRTLIAFNAYDGNGPIVRQNDWQQTTGRHLNHVDGGGTEAKASRLDTEAFQRAVTEAGL